MAYITPNSTVHILRGVTLDKDYMHTVRQTSAAAQYSSFSSYIKYTFSNLSYQRVNKGVIRVARSADDLYDCNYMIFKNTNFGDKWFYAFVNSVDYINNATSEISYTIDVMQTYYFDYQLEYCYVEREHSLTDNPGDNLVDENLNVGELVVQNTFEFIYPDSIAPNGIQYELVIFYVPNDSKKYIKGITISGTTVTFTYGDCKTGDLHDTSEILNGIYSGCKYFGIPFQLGADTNYTKHLIDTTISEILGPNIEGQIVNIVQVPFNLWTDWLINGGSTATRSISRFQNAACYNSDRTHFYTPKNRKLCTYPFRSLVVSNNAGKTATYKWEYFSHETGRLKQCDFKITGVPIMQPELMCYPVDYRGISKDYESGLLLQEFPMPSWSEDSFTKWWAENKNSYMYAGITAAILAGGIAGAGLAGGMPLGAAAGAAVSQAGPGILSQIHSGIGSYVKANDTPDQLGGQIADSALRTVQNRIGFTFYEMGLEMSRAKVIDNYFTMFGYAVKQVKIPNIGTNARLRPYWNYIKTNGCTIHATSGKGLPADDEVLITKIYDHGITFWNSLSNIGNYSLDNATPS